MPSFRRFTMLAAVTAVTVSVPTAAAEVTADPMRPDTLRAVQVVQPSRFRVNAIIVSDERRIAIVNGKRVGINDAIDAATVVSISRTEVVLQVNGRRQTLRVNSAAGQ